MNILVVNLTRFGDLLQSQAALSALAESADVALLCLENFAGAAAFLRGPRRLFTLPGGSILHGLDGNNSQAWPLALAGLESWHTELKSSFPADGICNLTPTLAARLLSRYLSSDGRGEEPGQEQDGARPIMGFGIDEYGFGRDSSPWAVFLQAASAGRGMSPFNVTDLFRAAAGQSRPGNQAAAQALLCPPPEEAVKGMRARLHQEADLAGATKLQGFVAMQLGASEEGRRWPIRYFAEVGAALWEKEGLAPLLLGSKDEERSLLPEYAAVASTPYVSLMGRTSLPELAAALQVARLLISNDTGTMHLAAGLQRPVLGIFLATAQAWDTGPYLAGSLALEPDLPCHPCAFGSPCPHGRRCLQAVRPDTVLALSREMLHGRASAGRAGEGARIWQGAHDEYGFMTLQSLSDHENEGRTIWMRLQRAFLRHFLDRDPTRPFTPPILSPLEDLPASEQKALREELGVLRPLLGLLLEQGGLLRQKPLPPLKERFLSTWRKVTDLMEQSRFLGALALLWREETQSRSSGLPEALKLIEDYKILLSALN